MTFLPILERELRVRARSRPAYWTRFAVALVGVLVCVPPLLWSGPFGAAATMGPGLLSAILSAAFLVSCAACLLTSDIISSERREGTLGLLLLTRVRAFDVLAGKLGSAGLTSLCALVAFLPMLMLPVLAGGVTGGEVVRKALVLPNTLFLALAAGLWASARGHEWFRTTRDALLLLATLVLVPVLVGPIMRRIGALGPDLGLLSPLGSLFAAGDAMYKVSPGAYWASLILVHAVGWALVLHAGFGLKHGWREQRDEATASAPLPVKQPDVAGRSRQPLADDVNPIAWLLRRQRGTQAILWAGALVGLAHHGFFILAARFVGPSMYSSLTWPLSLATTTLGTALFAWAASRFFVEARRTGELELLLTTPFGAKQIVSTQWQVLKRLLRWPIVVMLAPILLRLAYAIAMSLTGSIGGAAHGFPLGALNWLLDCVTIVVEVGALCWVGLWFGLRTGGQARAIVWTVTLVKGLPMLFSILFWILVPILFYSLGRRIGQSFWIMSFLPQAVGLLFYLVLIRMARHRLRGELAGAEAVSLGWRQAPSSAARSAFAAVRKARHWTPS